MAIAVIGTNNFLLALNSSESREAITLAVFADTIALNSIAVVLALEDAIACLAIESRVTETFSVRAHPVTAATPVAPKNVTTINTRESRVTIALSMDTLSVVGAAAWARNGDCAVKTGESKVTEALSFMTYTPTRASVGARHSVTAVRSSKALHTQTLSVQANTPVAAVTWTGDLDITDLSFITRETVALSEMTNSMLGTVILAAKKFGTAIMPSESRFT